MADEEEIFCRIVALDHFTSNYQNDVGDHFATIEHFGRFVEETKDYIILETSRDEFWNKDTLDDHKSEYVYILKKVILEKYRYLTYQILKGLKNG